MACTCCNSSYTRTCCGGSVLTSGGSYVCCGGQRLLLNSDGTLTQVGRCGCGCGCGASTGCTGCSGI